VTADVCRSRYAYVTQAGVSAPSQRLGPAGTAAPPADASAVADLDLDDLLGDEDDGAAASASGTAPSNAAAVLPATAQVRPREQPQPQPQPAGAHLVNDAAEWDFDADTALAEANAALEARLEAAMAAGRPPHSEGVGASDMASFDGAAAERARASKAADQLQARSHLFDRVLDALGGPLPAEAAARIAVPQAMNATITMAGPAPARAPSAVAPLSTDARAPTEGNASGAAAAPGEEDSWTAHFEVLAASLPAVDETYEPEPLPTEFEPAIPDAAVNAAWEALLGDVALPPADAGGAGGSELAEVIALLGRPAEADSVPRRPVRAGVVANVTAARGAAAPAAAPAPPPLPHVGSPGGRAGPSSAAASSPARALAAASPSGARPSRGAGGAAASRVSTARGAGRSAPTADDEPSSSDAESQSGAEDRSVATPADRAARMRAQRAALKQQAVALKANSAAIAGAGKDGAVTLPASSGGHNDAGAVSGDAELHHFIQQARAAAPRARATGPAAGMEAAHDGSDADADSDAGEAPAPSEEAAASLAASDAASEPDVGDSLAGPDELDYTAAPLSASRRTWVHNARPALPSSPLPAPLPAPVPAPAPLPAPLASALAPSLPAEAAGDASCSVAANSAPAAGLAPGEDEDDGAGFSVRVRRLASAPGTAAPTTARGSMSAFPASLADALMRARAPGAGLLGGAATYADTGALPTWDWGAARAIAEHKTVPPSNGAPHAADARAGGAATAVISAAPPQPPRRRAPSGNGDGAAEASAPGDALAAIFGLPSLAALQRRQARLPPREPGLLRRSDGPSQ
jgi:hypothetical protein